MTDDRLIDYLIDQGYEYDFEDQDWYTSDRKRAIEKEEEKFGATKTRGLRGALESEPVEGSHLAALKGVSKEVDRRINQIDSVHGLEGVSPEDITEYDPRLRRGRYPIDDAVRDRVVRRIKGLAEKYARDELGRLKSDIEKSTDRFRKAIKPEELREARRLVSETTEDTETVKKILRKVEGKAEQRVTSLGALREFGRVLSRDDLRDTGIRNVHAFAKTYGWNVKDKEDLEDARRVLERKGVVFTGKDKRGNDRYAIP